MTVLLKEYKEKYLKNKPIIYIYIENGLISSVIKQGTDTAVVIIDKDVCAVDNDLIDKDLNNDDCLLNIFDAPEDK